uniref:Connectin-like n=1 Tax=Diabrotica virgifera virgifera TaxID=50390 RepID=A0A6P7FSK7_DIAVI
MEKWLPILSSLLLPLAGLSTFEPSCKFHLSFLQGQQLTCNNVNMNYFHTVDIPLNRTHWFRCHNCTLDVLDESTFKFPKRNNISVVDLAYCGVRVLRKYAFENFFLMKVLVLHNNSIQILETMCFSGIKRVVHLDLSTNYIKILANNLFLELENLDILNLKLVID